MIAGRQPVADPGDQQRQQAEGRGQDDHEDGHPAVPAVQSWI